eukprot:GILK01012880.1.p1 GENE.GILK01012880.1~~GILK01012880.1.p1  ORF type:complete len:210 (-),score=33.99 GILK01012880.1:1158-1787(-)
MDEQKRYMEVMLGGGNKNANLAKFLENDRKVLRFFAVWDDICDDNHTRRPFTINFFLADDSVELRETYPVNSGRDAFPVFLRRQKLAKSPVQASSKPGTSGFYLAPDFVIGSRVHILGREFFIHDADPFSREYMLAQYGIQMVAAIDVEPPRPAPHQVVIPPYNGFGSVEDTMGSVLNLMPKAPKKDWKQLMTIDDKEILRFRARMFDS